ncbi:MAG: hypothetical protein GY765_23485 [bacterium]|nr:hypothetical protein [bacterium]
MKKKSCPCPNLNCPNHGNCEDCTSRHLKKGALTYCSFHTILPSLQKVMAEDPGSPTAKKLGALLKSPLQAYQTLMEKHGLSQEHQDNLLKMAAEYSDY